ncbi:putative Granulins [Hypsibius exemplaris]|uniref:Granulins n=1 Tax=Hypsibius exemplaris TaxID=2072580 RepID=A0A1W0X737_HYPEX|nr:putative Granulins [Hypsibius exemplaris]
MLKTVVVAWIGVFVGVSAVLVPSHPEKTNSNQWTSINATANAPNSVQSINAPVVCPGGSECPEFATCCTMPSGNYGCCPFPEAICCSDGAHCCPKNTKCDLDAGRCTTESAVDSFHAMAKKIIWPKMLKVKGNVKSITCGDKQSECPDSTTCCQLPSGDWGCCPFDGAICCSDKLHCCPKDTVCNMEQQRCQHQGRRFAAGVAFQKVYLYGNSSVSQSWELNDNTCPDQKQHCSDDATCCKLRSGSYGCCPFAKADCCSDGLHCCPEGKTCNVKAQRCD